MAFSWFMDKKIVTCPYSGLLHNNKQERTTDTCNNIYGSENHYIKGKKYHTLKTKPVRPSGTLNAIFLIYCGLGSCTNHHHILATQQLGLHIEPYLLRHSCSAKTPESSFQFHPVFLPFISRSCSQEQLNSFLFSVDLHFISEVT